MDDKEFEEFKGALANLSKTEREKFLTNLERVTFRFKINKSFLKYSAHPLTIPKEYYSFLDMHKISAGQDMSVVFPDGSSATSYIYHGSTPEWGAYRQIKIRNPYSGQGLAALKEGDMIKLVQCKLNY